MPESSSPPGWPTRRAGSRRPTTARSACRWAPTSASRRRWPVPGGMPATRRKVSPRRAARSCGRRGTVRPSWGRSRHVRRSLWVPGRRSSAPTRRRRDDAPGGRARRARRADRARSTVRAAVVSRSLAAAPRPSPSSSRSSSSWWSPSRRGARPHAPPPPPVSAASPRRPSTFQRTVTASSWRLSWVPRHDVSMAWAQRRGVSR